MPESSPRKERARRRGGAVAVGIYSAIIGGLTLLWSLQIMTQAWSQSGTTTMECREGVQSLLAAVRRARQSAGSQTGGEHAAVERFRAELQPEWKQRSAVGNRCKEDEDGRRLLREVDLLRYAEERSVRSDAVDVARRRRRVQALEATVTGVSAPPVTSSDLAKQPPAN
jgi:hypothetical protein